MTEQSKFRATLAADLMQVFQDPHGYHNDCSEMVLAPMARNAVRLADAIIAKILRTEDQIKRKGAVLGRR